MSTRKARKFTFTSYKNDRTDLADEIEAHWAGHNRSNVGLQYLKFEDGRVFNAHMSERKDIFMLQDLGVGINVFVHADGYWNHNWIASTGRVSRLDTFSPLVKAERDQIEEEVTLLLLKEAEYVNLHLAFFSERPWERCDGMTPERAVAHLRKWKADALMGTLPVPTPDPVRVTLIQAMFTREEISEALLNSVARDPLRIASDLLGDAADRHEHPSELVLAILPALTYDVMQLSNSLSIFENEDNR